MVWTPKLYSVSRPVVAANILAFIETNQTDALAWAKDLLGFDGDVPDFASIHNSSKGRVLTDFPNLMLIRRSTDFEDSPDGLHMVAVHSLGFELEITDSDPDVLTAKMEVYQLAVKAMLWSMTNEDLTEGLPQQGQARLEITSDDGDQTRGTQYLQAPHIVARVEVLEAPPLP